jgi:DNA-binding transcriptional ArsR family regulator
MGWQGDCLPTSTISLIGGREHRLAGGQIGPEGLQRWGWDHVAVSAIDPDAAAKAIAHPLRATILEKLDGTSRSASDLAEELERPIPNVAYHLLILYDLGAVRVTARHRGRGAVERFYTAAWRVRLVTEELE